MHLRRTLAVAATALALASTLSSCGFDHATDRVYTPAAGPLDRDATVDVLSAVIVSKAPGAGTFIGGILHSLPFLIPEYHAALVSALVVVAFELIALAALRARFFATSFTSSLAAVSLAGAVIVAISAAIGGTA